MKYVYEYTERMFASNLSHRDRKPKYISKFWTKHGGDDKRWPLTPFPFLAPWSSRPPVIETQPRPVPAVITQERVIMFSNPTPSKPRLSPAATMSNTTPSSLTPPLHCASILQTAAPRQVFAFESRTISAPICLTRFTIAESQKSDLWACVCVFTFSSSVFALLIKMNFSFKYLFAIWCYHHSNSTMKTL